MTFLNPAVLIGLLAAGFPLLLHLLNLRKLRIVEFSTISFLKELQKSTLRRLKFQYWLLLILRTLLLLFLVLAFARPVLRGTFGSGGHAATTMIIIIDNTSSMGRTDEHGMLLTQVQARADELLSLLREGDDGLVLRVAEGGAVPFASPTQNITLLRTIVRETKISTIHRPVDDALRTSARLLRGSTNPNKEIYILSDMQRACIQPQSDSTVIRSLFNNDVNIFTATIGQSSIENTGIVDVKTENTIIDLDRPCTMDAVVKNFGRLPLRTFVVSAYLGATRVQQKTIDLPPQQSTSVEFPLRLQHRGLTSGSIRIEDDQCEYDNVRYFSISVPDLIRIHLVIQSPDDFTYIRTALNLSQSAQRSPLFSVTSSAWNALSASSLRGMDIVVASMSNILPAEALQQLKGFALNGGTLILFPGRDITSPLLRRYAAALNLDGIDSVGIQQRTRDQFLTLDRVDIRHPIFNGMFEIQERDRTRGQHSGNTIHLSDAPRVYQSIIIHPNSKSNTLITLSDGNGFFTEYPSGDGKILIYSVPPTPEWSEFPLKGLFVPLVYRTMLYGGQAVSQNTPLLCGDPLSYSVPMPQSEEQMPWSIVSPDGDEVRVRPQTSSRQHFITVDGSTTLNGLYTLMQGTKPCAQYAVNIDPGESDLTHLDESVFHAHFSSYGIAANRIFRIDPSRKAREVVLESRYGQELWRYALLLALVCAVLEMFIAHNSKRYAQQELQ
jgi:hypothetical protein